MLAILPERSQLLLEEVDLLPSAPQVPRAALIALIASRYGHGVSPDEIAEGLLRAFLPGGEATEEAVLKDLVLPVCEKYKTGRLPFEAYWDPHGIYYELLDFYVGCRLLEDYQLGALESELSSHWLLEREETKAALIRSARSGWVEPILAVVEDPPDSPEGIAMRDAQGDPQSEQVVESYISSLSPRIHERAYLVRLVRLIASLGFVLSQEAPAGAQRAELEARQKVPPPASVPSTGSRGRRNI